MIEEKSAELRLSQNKLTELCLQRHLPKMTGGEFSRMDRKDSSADHTPIGSSDSETHETKEG